MLVFIMPRVVSLGFRTKWMSFHYWHIEKITSQYTTCLGMQCKGFWSRSLPWKRERLPDWQSVYMLVTSGTRVAKHYHLTVLEENTTIMEPLWKKMTSPTDTEFVRDLLTVSSLGCPPLACVFPRSHLWPVLLMESFVSYRDFNKVELSAACCPLWNVQPDL